MTRQSNDELREELNRGPHIGADSHHSRENESHSGAGSSQPGENRPPARNAHPRRGHLAEDSGPVDDDAINQDLHNVIAAYWKNRQKPGFVGYKNIEEDEEEEVRVEDDMDISFLRNPRRTKSTRPDTASYANGQKTSEEPAEPRDLTANGKQAEATAYEPAEPRDLTANVDKTDNPAIESAASEKVAGYPQGINTSEETPAEAQEFAEATATTEIPAEVPTQQTPGIKETGIPVGQSTEAKEENTSAEQPPKVKEENIPTQQAPGKTDGSADKPPQFQLSAEKLTEARETAKESVAPTVFAGTVATAAAADQTTKAAAADQLTTAAAADQLTTAAAAGQATKTATSDRLTRSVPPRHESVKSAGTDHDPPTKHTTARKKKRKKKKGPGRFFKWFFTILLLLVIGGAVTLGIMRYIGWKNSNRTNDSGEDISTLDGVISEDGGKTVVYKGVTYTYNEDLSTILFIGVDKEEYQEEGEQVSGEAGQADTVILTVVNQKTGETRMIPLSRSTMVPVDLYNTDGSYWKQENVQLAVSFAYGDNLDENCKNVAKSVSRILYGMPVHRYVTMDLSAIPQLNDAVGGVTVTCLEDMTDVDETWTEGAEITLHGKQAETYVRHRKTTISDETQDNNAPRMERQKQYINSFMRTLLRNIKGDIFIPLRLYRDVGDDIYSDVTTAEIVYYTSMVVSKGFNNSMLSIKGSVKHNEFTEFYPDEEKLYEMILDTFYERQ